MYDYKTINLSYLKGYGIDDIKKYLRYNGVKKFDDCDVRALKMIIEKIDTDCLSDFNVSYVIDRLDKEFDLVKLDESHVINIELKSSYKDIGQCIENYELLKNKYCDRDVIVYCYECTKDNIYYLNYQDKKFVETPFNELNKELSKMSKGIKLNINIDVNCIYRNSEIFLEHLYILSSSQATIKNAIIQSDKKINIIFGRAGCGKSVLALDLYNYYSNIENKDVQYLAPFKLNDIVDVKMINRINMKTVCKFFEISNYADIIIVDEAQRLKSADILVLPEKAREKVIFIGDINQNIDNESSFEELCNDTTNNFVRNMKSLIRTDDTFEIFARKILNISTSEIKHKKIDKNKIRIVMYGENLPDLSDYVFIAPSKSLYFGSCMNNCVNKKCLCISNKCKYTKVPHTAISLEYNNVIMFFCCGYDIDNNNIVKKFDLCSGNLNSQIYSIITRTINNLVIVADNIVLYNYLVDKLEQM